MTVRLLHGDCRQVLKTLPDNSVDSIVTDPPYHLTQASRGGHARTNNPGSPHGRHRIGDKGFMGKVWDGGDVAFQHETWAEAMRVLKPGGWLLAFGGTRTYHRLGCAIEDGGFEVRDMFGWLYGSGFPKGTDKAKIPAAWKGWNTAMKPAHEPICVARKPMEGTLAENLEKWGTGALWIDGCRVALGDEVIEVTGKGAIPARHVEDQPRNGAPIPPRAADLGRWPANIQHDGSDEVLAIFPANAGAQAPVTVRNGDKFRSTYGTFKGNRDEAGSTFHQGDSGSAARFFYTPKADAADRHEGMPQGQKNTHPTVKPTALMRYYCRLVTPPGGTVLDIFAGSGSTLKAAELERFHAIGIELEAEHVHIARHRVAGDTPLLADIAS